MNHKHIKVLVAGTFDFFHPGHQKFLRDAFQLGTDITVIVARDSSVLRIKKFLPTQSEHQRKKNIERWAAETYPENSGTKISVILGTEQREKFLDRAHKISPDIIALGYDQHPPKNFLDVFSDTKIVQLSPYFPEKFKSSFFRAPESHHLEQ